MEFPFGNRVYDLLCINDSVLFSVVIYFSLTQVWERGLKIIMHICLCVLACQLEGTVCK